MKAQDLKGEARELFEAYRAANYAEAEALSAVQRSGVMREPESYRTFRRLG